MNKLSNKFTHRYIARIVMEASTPISVGSGDKNFSTDATVIKDVNGLPFVPATSIAGILRHATSENDVFGFQDQRNATNSKGSEIIFSEAKMVGKDGKAVDGLQNVDWADDFYKYFKNLPIRQHVKINSRGVAEQGGKFDEEIVFKGTRFCFEMEMVSDGSNFHKFENMLKILKSSTFRVGGGTRKGFGEMIIISCQFVNWNLNEREGLKKYLAKSSALDSEFEGEEFLGSMENSDYTKYELTLFPQDFFLFGSGLGDDEADMTAVKESFIYWEGQRPQFVDNALLLPASSLKGALAHRFAFHYNKLNHHFIDKPNEAFEGKGGSQAAINKLFGSEGGKGKEKMENQMRGQVIFSDIIEDKGCSDKLLNHVAIDRFTGGAIAGALFSEKPTYGGGIELKTVILVKNAAFDSENPSIENAFDLALKDLCSGLLPLGGGVNRGHGIFTGKITKNGITL